MVQLLLWMSAGAETAELLLVLWSGYNKMPRICKTTLYHLISVQPADGSVIECRICPVMLCNPDMEVKLCNPGVKKEECIGDSIAEKDWDRCNEQTMFVM